jgi:hypothetical protein
MINATRATPNPVRAIFCFVQNFFGFITSIIIY